MDLEHKADCCVHRPSEAPLGCQIRLPNMPTMCGTLEGDFLPGRSPGHSGGLVSGHRLGGPGLGSGFSHLPSPTSHLRDRGAVAFPLGRARREWEGAVSSEGVALSLRILPVRQALGETGRPLERISPRWSLVSSGVSPTQPCGHQGLSFFFGPVPCTAGPLAASRGSTH